MPLNIVACLKISRVLCFSTSSPVIFLIFLFFAELCESFIFCGIPQNQCFILELIGAEKKKYEPENSFVISFIISQNHFVNWPLKTREFLQLVVGEKSGISSIVC